MQKSTRRAQQQIWADGTTNGLRRCLKLSSPRKRENNEEKLQSLEALGTPTYASEDSQKKRRQSDRIFEKIMTEPS